MKKELHMRKCRFVLVVLSSLHERVLKILLENVFQQVM